LAFDGCRLGWHRVWIIIGYGCGSRGTRIAEVKVIGTIFVVGVAAEDDVVHELVIAQVGRVWRRFPGVSNRTSTSLSAPAELVSETVAELGGNDALSFHSALVCSLCFIVRELELVICRFLVIDVASVAALERLDPVDEDELAFGWDHEDLS
jgi:hypothetical protein